MASKLTFQYDAIGDILYVEKCPPYAAQGSRQIEDEIVVRFNPTTREIESLEILFFSKRIQDGSPFELPIAAELGVVA
jgi:hypothetical protein